MNDELNTLVTGLYVEIDGQIAMSRAPGHPPQFTGAGRRGPSLRQLRDSQSG
ncbi:hypothetical protein ACFC8N_16430 [Streptomyces sp. NPDC055966]|uniref:hypothetical protein n=1 Tax=Streptomyces sp. NPDC055966 TaxID=3345669 RepID=UPI0035DF33C9